MVIRNLLACVCVLILIALAGCSSAASPDRQAAPEGMYSFWPPVPDAPRIQFIKSYSFSSDVEPPPSAFDKVVFGTEHEVLPIGKPYGVAMWNGCIYVCDTVNPGLVVLDLRKQQTRVMSASGVGSMTQPTDIAVARDGMKYVADKPAGRVFVFNAQDRPVSSFGWKGFSPVGVAVHENELYVAEAETTSIIVLDRFTGENLRSFGEPGGDPGQFVLPLGIDTDREGNIYVTDVISGRLQKFTNAGEFVFSQGQLADQAGNFVRPKHVAVDDDGVIYVVDAAFQNVQMFNADAEVLMFFGSPGSHPGAMSLPVGITTHEADLDLFADEIHPAFRPTRLIVVTNQFGLQKVAVYAMGELREGYTVQDILPNVMQVETGLAEDEQLDRGQELLRQNAPGAERPPAPEEQPTPQVPTEREEPEAEAEPLPDLPGKFPK